MLNKILKLNIDHTLIEYYRVIYIDCYYIYNIMELRQFDVGIETISWHSMILKIVSN